ncbi:PD40 domain-containing protein, partial [candidate division KSB1 bacterium]|nr:PD40 domain-containing protein [candidate division KSB1 bacterium]
MKRLTNDFYDDRDPAWSPNARAIAFSSDRSYFGKDGYMNIFLYNLQTGKIQYLTEGAHNDYAPSWSPDGESLAFTSDRDGPFNIWIIKNNGREFEALPIADNFTDSSNNAHNGKNRLNGNGIFKKGQTKNFFPSALEKTDQLKKLTKFTTGAFDPVWLDEDNLVFTAFENFSFQLQQIINVEEKFEEAPSVKNDILST